MISDYDESVTNIQNIIIISYNQCPHQTPQSVYFLQVLMNIIH